MDARNARVFLDAADVSRRHSHRVEVFLKAAVITEEDAPKSWRRILTRTERPAEEIIS